METKKERIEKTVVEEKVTYVACDGKEFTDKEQCQEYEKSAKCAITAMYKELVVAQTSADSLLFGSDCEDIDIIEINDEGSLRAALMYLNMKDPSGTGFKVLKKEDVGKKIMIGWNEFRDYFWRIGSLDELIDGIKNVYTKCIENPGQIYVF